MMLRPDSCGGALAARSGKNGTRSVTAPAQAGAGAPLRPAFGAAPRRARGVKRRAAPRPALLG